MRRDYKIFVTDLSEWFLRHQRPLPWRKTKDPYRIWLSEMMLQQTQVATVIPYYEKFLDKFPTLSDLAAADEESVMKLWAGLGYYSRARNLHRGARFIVDKGGSFPQTRDEMLKVPGVGPYTAGAVLSIAFNLHEPLVDGNVMRVFARWLGEEREIETREVQNLFWKFAKELVSMSKNPRVFNQALMELGATLCTKGAPNCDRCPVRKGCLARLRGREKELPLRRPRRKKEACVFLGVIFESNGQVLLRQHQKNEWWNGLWNFPMNSLKTVSDKETAIQKLVATVKPTQWDELGSTHHTVTHHALRIDSLHLRVKSVFPPRDPQERWVGWNEIPGLPLSSLAKKILAALHPEWVV